MNTGVTEEYLASIKDEYRMYEADIMQGKCTSYDQYKYKIGYVQGLQKAEQLLHETIEQMLVAQDLD